MNKMTLSFPELSNFNEHEVKMIVAGEFYKRGNISLGQAADLVGISKRAFIETMGDYGYSVFGDDPDELISDIKNAGANDNS